jgi:hypothetical protein
MSKKQKASATDRSLSSFFEGSTKHATVYAISLMIYLLVVWSATQPGEPFIDKLFEAGILWIIFAIFTLVFSGGAIWMHLKK